MKQKIIDFFRNAYRLTLSKKGQLNCVWSDIKKFYKANEWKYSIIERDDLLVVQAVFRIDDHLFLQVDTIMRDNFVTLRSTIPLKYADELAEDVFILATHLNNLFRHTKVCTYTESNEIDVSINIDYKVLLLDPSTNFYLLKLIYETAEDVHWVYKRLLETREAPALIFAEFLERLNTKEKEGESKSEWSR